MCGEEILEIIFGGVKERFPTNSFVFMMTF